MPWRRAGFWWDKRAAPVTPGHGRRDPDLLRAGRATLTTLLSLGWRRRGAVGEGGSVKRSSHSSPPDGAAKNDGLLPRPAQVQEVGRVLTRRTASPVSSG